MEHLLKCVSRDTGGQTSNIIRKLFWGLFMGLGGHQNNHQIFLKLLDTMFLTTITYHLIISIIYMMKKKKNPYFSF